MFTVGTHRQNLIVINYASLKSTQTAERPRQRNVNTKLSDATVWATCVLLLTWRSWCWSTQNTCGSKTVHRGFRAFPGPNPCEKSSQVPFRYPQINNSVTDNRTLHFVSVVCEAEISFFSANSVALLGFTPDSC